MWKLEINQFFFLRHLLTSRCLTGPSSVHSTVWNNMDAVKAMEDPVIALRECLEWDPGYLLHVFT